MKKIEICNIGFYFILLLMLLGSAASYISIFCVIMSIFIAIIIGIQIAKKPSVYVCNGIIGLLLYQNLCIGLSSHFFDNMTNNLKFITQIPFITLSIVWIIQIIFNKKYSNDKAFRFFLFYLILIGISFFIARGTALSILMNLRNLTTFFFAYQIGKYNITSIDDFYIVVKYVLKNAIIFLFFGILLNSGGYSYYEKIGINEVYFAKGGRVFGKLDDRFYTTLVRTQVLRMGSLMMEPVNLAYFFSLAVILSYFTDWTKKILLKYFVFVLCTIGLILTFGKGGYLITITAFVAYYAHKFFQSILHGEFYKIFKVTIVIIILFFISFCLYYYKNIGAAASVHFWAIERTWRSVLAKPYGYGLGTGGNMSQLFNGGASTTWLDTGGESALMSFMYQIGIQGVIALVLCFVKIINLKKEKFSKIMSVCVYLPFVILGVSLLQDNTFTPQCIVPFMLIIGACNNEKFVKEN